MKEHKMSRDELNEKIIGVVSKVLQIEPAEVTPELAIGDVPTWDSMGNFVLLQTLESEIGFEFDPSELFEMTSVAKISAKIEEIVGKNV